MCREIYTMRFMDAVSGTVSGHSIWPFARSVPAHKLCCVTTSGEALYGFARGDGVQGPGLSPDGNTQR